MAYPFAGTCEKTFWLFLQCQIQAKLLGPVLWEVVDIKGVRKFLLFVESFFGGASLNISSFRE